MLTPVPRTPAQRPLRVLVAMYTSPVGYPPIERAATILLNHGAEVRILGTYGHNTDALGRLGDDRIDLRLVSGVGRGVIQKLRYLFFNIWSLCHVLWWRPDWYYASDPMATPAALVAAALGTKVVYHEHDVPADGAGSRFMRAIAASRKLLLRRAAIVIAPNAQRAALLAAGSSGETLVVWNCPSRDEVVDHASGRETEVLRVIYHGTIVPARLPLAMIDALTQARHRIELTVIGYETIGAPEYGRTLRERADAHGIGDRVAFVGILPRVKMLEWASRSDLGLALMPMASGDLNERMMAGASNKAFEYLAVGTPVLVADLPEWRALYVERGVALAGDSSDAASLASALDWAFEHRDALSAMGKRGQRIVEEEWNYEMQFEPVVQRLFQAPHERPASANNEGSDARDALIRGS